MNDSGSPFWQMVILAVAGLFMLWEIWRGWRIGVVRSGLQVAAVILASVVAMAVANLVAAPVGGLNSTAGLVTGLPIGLAAALAVFILMWILSAVLFKRTEHQGTGPFRLLWGLGGAFCGAVMGVILLLGAVFAIRAFGTLVEENSRPLPPRQFPLASPTPKPVIARLSGSLVTLKNSLELGPVGKAVETVDPIPEGTYKLIQEVGRITHDPNAMIRMFEYPDIQRVFQTPRMAELLSDPEIVKASQEGNVLALMTNKKLLAAVEDPAFAAELKKVDLQAALKFALANPSASPSPSPSPFPTPIPAKKK